MRYRVVPAILGLFSIYFPIALYLKATHVPAPQQDDGRIWLTGPFIPLGGAAYIAQLPKLNHLADSNEEPVQSTIILEENEKPIGPAHAEHAEIASLGRGRYSHWKDQGLIFSTGNNSDPNRNWKRYSITIGSSNKPPL